MTPRASKAATKAPDRTILIRPHVLVAVLSVECLSSCGGVTKKYEDEHDDKNAVSAVQMCCTMIGTDYVMNEVCANARK